MSSENTYGQWDDDAHEASQQSQEATAPQATGWDDDAIEVAASPPVPAPGSHDTYSPSSFIESLISPIPILSQGSIGGRIPIIGPLAEKAGDALNAGIQKATGDPRSYGDIYKTVREFQGKKNETFEKEHAGAAIAQSIIGTGSSGGLDLGMAAGIKGAGAIARAGRGLVNIADQVIPNTAVAYGDAKIRGASEDHAEESAVNVAKWTAGLTAIPKALSLLGRGAAGAYAGIGGQTIDKYKAGKARINDLTEEAAMNQVEGAAQTVSGKGDELIGQAKDASRRSRDAAMIESQNVRMDAIDRARRAEEAGKSQADDLTRSVADDLVQGVGNARKAVSKSSGEAFDILDNAGILIPTSHLQDALKTRIDNFKIGNALPDSPEVQVLKKYHALVGKVGEDITPVDLKRLVQQMDNEIHDSYARSPRGELTNADYELQGARRDIDQNLKEIPEYAEAMIPTAKKTQVLNNLKKAIPPEGDSAYGKLKNVLKPGSQDKARALTDFEQEFGGDFTNRLKQADELRNRDYRGTIQADLDRANAIIQKDYAAPHVPMINEGKRLKEVARGFGESRSQQALKRFGDNPKNNVDLGRRFDSLAEEANSINPALNFQPRQLADDLKVKRSFETAYVRGSRNVNAAAMSVAGIAKMFGAALEQIPGFLGIGAVLGHAADRFGPQGVKSVIDGLDHPAARRFGQIYIKAANQIPLGVVRAQQQMSEETPRASPNP